MSSTASLTCVDGWTPPTSPAPVSRPALLTASRSTSAAPGRCAIYALRAATPPSSSLIFSASSASSSIAYLRLVSLGSGSPNHDGVSELKGRGYVPQSLDCLAGASNGERTETKDSTENGLTHVHALDLRHVDFCRVPLHQPRLVDHPMVGHGDLSAEHAGMNSRTPATALKPDRITSTRC